MPTDLPVATNESFELKKIQTGVAASLAALMHSMGGKVQWYPRAWDDKVYNQFLSSEHWRKDNQIIYFYHNRSDGRKSEYVKFSDVFYDPASDFVEGTPQLLQNVEVRDDGLSKIFDNSKGKDPLHIAYQQEVSLENSVSNSIRNAFTFDTTVTSETTVSGSYAGASLEQKITAEVHAGLEKETTKDTAESKTDTDTVAIEFDVPAGAVKLLEVTKDRKRELIPTEGTFIANFGIQLKYYHWWQEEGRHGLRYRAHHVDNFKFESLEELWQYVQGTNTNHPEMVNFWNDDKACNARVRNGLLHLMKPENRSYYLNIDKMRIIEDNADYKVVDLDGPDHAAGAGLDVVDLSEELEREQYTNG